MFGSQCTCSWLRRSAWQGDQRAGEPFWMSRVSRNKGETACRPCAQPYERCLTCALSGRGMSNLSLDKRDRAFFTLNSFTALYEQCTGLLAKLKNLNNITQLVRHRAASFWHKPVTPSLKRACAYCCASESLPTLCCERATQA